jgi:ketosteroid isomerase-like protein
VEVVLRGVDSFNRRDVAAMLRDFDEDAEWVEDQRYPGAETFRGPSGVERSIRKWWGAWREIAMVFDEAIDLGDRVVLAGRVRGPGHDSDVTVEAPFGGVYELRGGKVVRVQVLGSREEIGSREYPPLLRKICLFTPCELGHQRTVRRMRSGLATSPSDLPNEKR